MNNTFGNVDWWQGNQDYYGVASSQCAPFVGWSLGRGRGSVLDEYGMKLLTVCFPGDWWRKRHDWIKWDIARWLEYCLVDFTCEALNIFTACIHQAATFHDLPRRQRQAIVPDFLYRPFPKPAEFEELKCTASKSFFNASTVEVRCGGVEKRADKIWPDYIAKTVKTDRDHNNWDRAANGPGPVEQRLQSYGPVRGLVFGPRGESSNDVERLIQLSAEIGADRRWRELGARSKVEAKAFIARTMRESIGITAVRAFAMVKRECLGIMLGNAHAGAARRKTANQFAKELAQDYNSWANGGRYD